MEKRDMTGSQVLDSLFQRAVAAIDAGELAALQQLLNSHPDLVSERLDEPGEWLREQIGEALDGFFQRPYLLWFVAEDPTRTGRLPENIADVTRSIIQAARRQRLQSLQEQLDYALRLVAWSGVAREYGVQNGLMDVLVDAGASLEGQPEAALVNGHVVAAELLLEKGAPLSLASALCLGRWGDVNRLAPASTARERQGALVLGALRGKAEAVRRLIELGVDLDAPSVDLYSHATPLHHAVWSGSLDTVKALVDAGARLDLRDTANDATPLGWAEHAAGGNERAFRYAEIAAYLRER